MRAFKLAWQEIRRFRKPLQRAALVFIVLVPLLYGGLYLWANWDPYGKLNQIPVAVVNEDKPVDVQGQHVDAGKIFTDELRNDRIFDWHFVSRAEADNGVHDGSYYFKISVPEDFSRKLASGANGTPQRAGMLITLDDANGYIVGKMAQTVQSELQTKISAAAVSAYFQSVFGNMQRLHDGITDASKGADQLRDGLGSAQKGSGDLVTGLDKLKAGADKLAPGAQQVADGVGTINDRVGPVANRIADSIPAITGTASTAANDAATLAGKASDVSNRFSGKLDTIQGRITQVGQNHPEVQSDPAYQRLAEIAGDLTSSVNQVNATAGTVKNRTASVAQGASAVAADAPQLQAQVSGAAGKLQQLSNGAKDVAKGASDLDNGIGQATPGAKSLNQGIGTLHGGADKLSKGLKDAKDQLPVLSSQQQRDNAATLASPVDVATENLHPADNYGRGLTPFFFSIALVVFGITAFLVLRPISKRALASKANSFVVAFSGYLPAATCCVLAAVLLDVVVSLGLGLDARYPWALLGIMVLAAAAFTAIAHLCRVALGGVGSAVILILLLLQLTTCAGTYPAETLPGFFRALHPVLPMSYLVEGLRVTITGGDNAHLVRSVLVLAGYLIAALALSTFLAKRKREWSIAKLKPDLSI
ncbi:YhgE/Pip family protein [Sciscionella sediminilitoris]|uniref:YhgE/Pip family protein n=1 Tax=Sciscionella sediminilitoris TaxID=1445613 RepID=UPI0004DF04B5|nr:YhgE/Pip domain-containing protein [Sciscionella sp. SE31]